MSDNDLISREGVEDARCEILRVLNYIDSSGRLDYADYCELFDTIDREFDNLKIIPREMSASEYLALEIRMSKYYGLPYTFTVDEAIELVEEFARKHPEERSENDE